MNHLWLEWMKFSLLTSVVYVEIGSINHCCICLDLCFFFFLTSPFHAQSQIEFFMDFCKGEKRILIQKNSYKSMQIPQKIKRENYREKKALVTPGTTEITGQSWESTLNFWEYSFLDRDTVFEIIFYFFDWHMTFVMVFLFYRSKNGFQDHFLLCR